MSTYITHLPFVWSGGGRGGIKTCVLLIRYHTLRNNQHDWITLLSASFFSFWKRKANQNTATISGAFSRTISCTPPYWPRHVPLACQECFRLPVNRARRQNYEKSDDRNWLCRFLNTVTKKWPDPSGSGVLCRNPSLTMITALIQAWGVGVSV